MSTLCDTHLHVYRPGCPQWRRVAPAGAADASLVDYLRLQRRVGATRMVIVQPSLYGTDNSYMLECIQKVGRDQAAGIAILDPQISPEGLAELKAGGVMGARFWIGTFINASTPIETTLATMREMDARLAEHGMHLQAGVDGEFLHQHARQLRRFRCPLVIDHLGHVPPDTRGLPELLALLDEGNTWVKISGIYLDSDIGPPDYPDMRGIVQSLVRAQPRRMLWATNWPHPTTRPDRPFPDDAAIVRTLCDWIPSADVRERLFDGNAAELYGFPQQHVVRP